MVASKQTKQARKNKRPKTPRRGNADADHGAVPENITRDQMLEVIRGVASGVSVEEALVHVVGGTAGTEPRPTVNRGEKAHSGKTSSVTSATQQNPGARRTHTPEEKMRALELVVSGIKQRDIATTLGVHEKTISTWVCRARKNGDMPEQAPGARVAANAMVSNGEDNKQQAKAVEQNKLPSKSTKLYAPKDPGQGLAEYEKEAILELKKEHPSYGPAQVRAQLKRFKGWRLSIKAIAKVFRDNGYQLVHRGSRPEGPEPIRFEAPRRNALWQIDFAEMRIVGEKLHLCVALDDFSRYVVGHMLAEHPSSEIAVEVLQNAIARHGKPESLRTDRGGGFLSKEFTDVLEAEVIDHIVGRSYHPQGGGKVESIIGTVRRELWDVEQFDNREHALQRIREFFDDYNEQRAHMGIDGLTPADRYFGRGDRVLAAVNASSRNRNGALSHAGKAFEELVHPSVQTPMEVLRLVLVNGKMELRFCGARVELGQIAGV